MAKFHWDKASKENLAQRHGSEQIEPEAVEIRRAGAVWGWMRLTESLRTREIPRESVIRLVKKDGSTKFISKRGRKSGKQRRDEGVKVCQLAEETGASALVVIRQLRAYGYIAHTLNDIVPTRLAGKVRHCLTRKRLKLKSAK